MALEWSAMPSDVAAGGFDLDDVSAMVCKEPSGPGGGGASPKLENAGSRCGCGFHGVPIMPIASLHRIGSGLRAEVSAACVHVALVHR